MMRKALTGEKVFWVCYDEVAGWTITEGTVVTSYTSRRCNKATAGARVVFTHQKTHHGETYESKMDAFAASCFRTREKAEEFIRRHNRPCLPC